MAESFTTEMAQRAVDDAVQCPKPRSGEASIG
jgi:hypothetical protein